MPESLEDELVGLVTENWGLVFDLHQRALEIRDRLLTDTRARFEATEAFAGLSSMDPYFEGKTAWTIHFPADWLAWVSLGIETRADRPTARVTSAFNGRGVTRADVKAAVARRVPAAISSFGDAVDSRSSNAYLVSRACSSADPAELVELAVSEVQAQLEVALVAVDVIRDMRA